MKKVNNTAIPTPNEVKKIFQNELQILALTQSEYVPGVKEYYSNISLWQNTWIDSMQEAVRKKWLAFRKDKYKPRPHIAYYMMSMEGSKTLKSEIADLNGGSNFDPVYFKKKEQSG